MTASTSPFPFGTWELIAQGKTLIGVDEDDTNFASAGLTGGSKTITPSGTVGAHTLTTNEIPSHAHYEKIYFAQSGYGATIPAHNNYLIPYSNAFGYTTSVMTNMNLFSGGITTSVGGGDSHTHGFTGASHTNLPPYITCYIWQRTA